MMRSRGLATLLLVLLTGSLALAQAPAGGGPSTALGAGQRGGGQPAMPPMTNLQIFPKDTPRPQVIQTMNGFTQSLGVQANLEFYPKSARTYQTMAQVKNGKGDKDGAIKDLEAVELDPNNQQAKMQLQQLKGQ